MVDLKKEREKKGLQQKQLAEKVGVTKQAIFLIEKGVNKPTPELAKKLAKELGLKWPDFF